MAERMSFSHRRIGGPRCCGLHLLVGLLMLCPGWGAVAEPDDPHNNGLTYGVDVSFPMQHNFVSDNYAWLPHNLDPSLPVPDQYVDKPVQPLGDRQTFYDNFLQGCVQFYGEKGGRRCVSTERDRIEMSMRQPQSMQNYTTMGFKKIRAPAALMELVNDFWKKNKDKEKPEQWGIGNTYTNNWEAPTYMVSVEDRGLRGGGMKLKQAIWNAAQDTISEWTQQQLTQCSLYGIRVYKTGAVLATHVDRLPLVSSAIINVAQDVDEPWPLEVIGHDGIAHNVTMEPGDMILYESHAVLHGRPYPLKGRFMANIFVHFEPTGHSLRHAGIKVEEDQHATKFKESVQKKQSGHEHEHDGLPPYIIPGTPEEQHYRAANPAGYDQASGRNPGFTTGSTPAHSAAQQGNLEELKAHVHNDKTVIHHKDANGWQPIHEAIRGGHVEVVKYLLEQGADVNARTGREGEGGSPLWWAKQTHGEEHEVITLLTEMGALDMGPEL